MTKLIEICSVEDIDHWMEVLKGTGQATKEAVGELQQQDDGVAMLAAMKFRQTGFDPFDPDRRLNLIEQLNQTFTYLASLKAGLFLLHNFPQALPLRMNLGTCSGSDVESDQCGGIAAEVFAAVTPTNNRKLSKDVEKVAAVEADHRFVFFMCPEFEKGPQRCNERHPDVQIHSLGFDW